jgi:tetratricopeptide (TPR) repeat protein
MANPKNSRRKAAPQPPRVAEGTRRDSGYATREEEAGDIQATPSLPVIYDYLVFAGFLIVGLLLRAAYLHEIRQQPDFDCPLADARVYNTWARNIVSGDWSVPEGRTDTLINKMPFLRPPGYPYFLALIYWVTGGSYLAIRLVQMSMGLASAVLAFVLGRRVFGRLAGVAAGAMMSTYWVFIFYEGELNSPPIVVFLLLILMVVLHRWLARRALWLMLIAGVVLGVLVVVRPELLAGVGPILLWQFWSGRPGARIRSMMLPALVFVLGIALPIAPVTIRNYAVSKEVVLLCTGGGLNLYFCNNDRFEGTWAVPGSDHGLPIQSMSFDDEDIMKGIWAYGEMVHRSDVTFSEMSRYFGRVGRRYIIDHPGRTLKMMVRKTFLFWGPAEVSNNKADSCAKQFSSSLRFLPGFPYVAALAALGIGLLARTYWRRKPTPDNRLTRSMVVLFLLYVFTCFSSLLPFIVPARFRVPVIPFLILFGSVAVAALVERLYHRQWRSAAVLCLSGAGLFVFFSIPFASYRPSVSQWYAQRGMAFQKKHQFAQAEEELRKAVAVQDIGWSCTYYLANVLAEGGKSEEAVYWYNRAIAETADPDPRMYNDLGHTLYKLGQFDKAVAWYEESIRLDRFRPLTHLNLGLALADLGRYDEAIDQFKTVLALHPEDPNVTYDWGVVLEMQGKTEQAMQKYQETIAQFPDHADAYNNLGFDLLKLGRVEEAKMHLETALALKPDHALAHLNLGMLLKGQGDKVQALYHLNEALHLDPDNEFAREQIGQLERK